MLFYQTAPVAAFSAFRASSATVAEGATIAFDSERFDVSGNYDSTTGVFTCPQDGYYFFSLTVYSHFDNDIVSLQI